MHTDFLFFIFLFDSSVLQIFEYISISEKIIIDKILSYI